MDELRNIRFLIPPFFFFLSAFLAAYFSGGGLATLISPFSTEQALALTAAIGAATLPIGYLITSISILALQILARCCGAKTYEAHLSDSAFASVWTATRSTLESDRELELYAVATYDHSILPPAIHQWIQRRWNSFNIAAHSCMALLLSLIAALLPGVHFSCQWLGCLLLLLAVFAINGYRAWRQAMRMLDFQLSRQATPDVVAQPIIPPDAAR